MSSCIKQLGNKIKYIRQKYKAVMSEKRKNEVSPIIVPVYYEEYSKETATEETTSRNIIFKLFKIVIKRIS
jgi:hypothetical protein